MRTIGWVIMLFGLGTASLAARSPQDSRPQAAEKPARIEEGRRQAPKSPQTSQTGSRGRSMSQMRPATPQSLPGHQKLRSQQALNFEELVFLLSVGADNAAVLEILNRRGWPETFSQAQLAEAERLGAGTALRLGILERLDIGSNRSKRLTRFEAYDGVFSKNRRYSILVPKGYQISSSQGGRRLELRGPGKTEWFGRRSYFVWLIDRGDWRKGDTRALASIVAEAAVQRLEKGGLVMSALSESTIRDPESQRIFPYFDALGRDPQTGLSGLFAVTLRFDAAKDLIAVVGFSKPTAKPGQDEVDDPASIVGLLAGSLNVQRP